MGGGHLEHLELYRQDDFPVFQNRMYDSVVEARDCPRGDIRIVQDAKTGMVRNAAFDPSLMHYDSAYQNEQGLSARFDAHLDRIAELVLSLMGTDELVEVGCGKARFLDKLRKRGADITGFDPAYEGDDPTILRRVFEEDLGIWSRGLILRHVLEHIEDPIAFLFRLAAANGHQGLIYIEVPCLDWILENRTWFDFFYEHVNYFRLSDFQRIFGRTFHLGHSFNGQYLSVVGDLASLRHPVFQPDDKVVMPEPFLPAPDAYCANSEGQTVIWGGASKGVIFSLLRERAGVPVDRVIDINPGKQGKYLAATGHKVETPQSVLGDLAKGSEILVMNPNYLEEIRETGGPNFQYRAINDS